MIARKQEPEMGNVVLLNLFEDPGGAKDEFLRECDLATAFFFQAEGGIRHADVTGVQTCALPISAPTSCSPTVERRRQPSTGVNGGSTMSAHRSEERRVGKECRSRWSPDH